MDGPAVPEVLSAVALILVTLGRRPARPVTTGLHGNDVRAIRHERLLPRSDV
jgi:hypothetical protein